MVEPGMEVLKGPEMYQPWHQALARCTGSVWFVRRVGVGWLVGRLEPNGLLALYNTRILDATQTQAR